MALRCEISKIAKLKSKITKNREKSRNFQRHTTARASLALATLALARASRKIQVRRHYFFFFSRSPGARVQELHGRGAVFARRRYAAPRSGSSAQVQPRVASARAAANLQSQHVPISSLNFSSFSACAPVFFAMRERARAQRARAMREQSCAVRDFAIFRDFRDFSLALREKYRCAK